MKSSRSALVIALVAQLIAVSCVSAQGVSSELSERLLNQYVRVTAPAFSSKQLKGQLVKVSADTIVIRTVNFGRVVNRYITVGIPIEAMANLEIRTNLKRQWKKGMGYGFLTGAGITVALAASASPKDGSFFNGSERELAWAFGAVIITPATTLLGTLLGLTVMSKSWEKVKSSPFDVGIIPQSNGGFALSTSFKF